ncbi:hypothetical protein EJ04DRAFT_561530 [Polyplosphaeria fusca]|uniref:Uncharacterized protein n=1 Tax=Polyplosphaeria fusca TaxID=682080 RepID=A0A9P4R2S0_9PLEO|nr:hypothetical protein EJ04DRAFT_561530 [Polyplosphaeria fusca]
MKPLAIAGLILTGLASVAFGAPASEESETTVKYAGAPRSVLEPGHGLAARQDFGETLPRSIIERTSETDSSPVIGQVQGCQQNKCSPNGDIYCCNNGFCSVKHYCVGSKKCCKRGGKYKCSCARELEKADTSASLDARTDTAGTDLTGDNIKCDPKCHKGRKCCRTLDGNKCKQVCDHEDSVTAIEIPQAPSTDMMERDTLPKTPTPAISSAVSETQDTQSDDPAPTTMGDCNTPGQTQCFFLPGTKDGRRYNTYAIYVCNAVKQWTMEAICGTSWDGGPVCCAYSNGVAFCKGTCDWGQLTTKSLELDAVPKALARSDIAEHCDTPGTYRCAYATGTKDANSSSILFN